MGDRRFDTSTFFFFFEFSDFHSSVLEGQNRILKPQMSREVEPQILIDNPIIIIQRAMPP